MLVTLEEVQALVALFGKTPMTPAELLWANMFANRLFMYAQPPKPEGSAAEPEVDLDVKQPGPNEEA